MLHLSCQHLPGITVVAIAGEIDIATADELETFIREARLHPSDHLVFDLAEMTFIASVGLQVLLDAARFTRRHDGTVQLAALRSEPRRIMEITQVDTQLPVHASVEQAIAAVLNAQIRASRTGAGSEGASSA
ncbi:STAS domain-containing protein [Nonomuraea sp. NPDC059194]|uniref:STAS domain-containing protein n=1 Tax=Nonomuraea sp. NPDC059194 TaxID=3346764 RepID=UPI0036A74439